MTIHEAARRAAEKIELRFGRPDRPVDELAVEQIIAAEFASLYAEIARLRGLLEHHWAHSNNCREDQAASGMLGLAIKCICGLDAALKGASNG